MYEPLTSFLLRAPLLPERALRDPRALARHPLGATALALASPDLAAAPAASAQRQRALGRYARRAAFRPTPQGLLAGVCVGELSNRLAIATGGATPRLAPAWARMAALGRALLDWAELRARVRLRTAPSLTWGAGSARWIGPGQPFGETQEADIDARLERVLLAAARFAPWPAVRRALGHERRAGRHADGESDADPEAADDAADELLLVMIDRGLLHADVTPPLVGAPPAIWMRDRLAALGLPDLAARLEQARRALDAGDLAAGARALAELPGGDRDRDGGDGARAVHAVLVLAPPRPPSLPRAAVARAARLAPLLVRLQEALAPPAFERAAETGLLDAADAATELFGDGAVDLGLLEAGAYGIEAQGGIETETDPRTGPPAARPPTLGAAAARVLSTMVDALLRAAAGGAEEAALDPAALAAALGDDDSPPLPASCELFLAPGLPVAGAPPGTGWLLGLHGPAGASWGRFAAALGAPLGRALAELDAAERAARPFETRVDVAFAPAPALADLCTHPAARARTLALSTWSDGDGGGARDVTPAELDLIIDEGGAPALRARGGGAPLVPSPLARVRSATAPPGLARLLVAWGLQRQHAPWALAGGPLAALERAPRLSIDGFVVAPGSWLVPVALRSGRARPQAIARWRRAAGVPRVVQVGDEDQLLPVDLDGRDAAADLRGCARAFEIWPPLGATADRDGRRVEAVVALVDRPDPARAAALEGAARAVAAARRVPPPHEAPPLPGWRTFKLHGPADLQEPLLLAAFHDAIAPARRAREIARWFFIRYVDGPGHRPHLRLRVEEASLRARAAFEARLLRALAPLRAGGAVVAVDIGDYFPERARFGGGATALDLAHALFESDSTLACALLGAEASDGGGGGGEPGRAVRLVQSLDALARGLGLDLAARHQLARARRDAEERLLAARAGDGDSGGDARAERDRAFRALARDLRAALGRPPGDAVTRALDAHAARTRRATRRLSPPARAALAPALLHLACIRLVGPDRDAELDAYTLWDRTLEGLLRSPLPPQ